MIGLLLGLTAANLVAWVVFIGLYLRSRWWETPIGQNMMVKAVALAVVFGLSLAGYLWRIPVWIWAGALTALGVVAWWRVVILWRIQRASR